MTNFTAMSHIGFNVSLGMLQQQHKKEVMILSWIIPWLLNLLTILLPLSTNNSSVKAQSPTLSFLGFESSSTKE
jgi:hypothetical protein